MKRDLVLDAIAEREGLKVSDTEIQSWLDMYAAIGGRRMRLRDLRPGQRAGIESSLLRDKATERLVEIATAEASEIGEPAESTEEAGAKAAARAAATSATDESAAESATPAARQTKAAEAETPAESSTDVTPANVGTASPPETATSTPKAAAKGSVAPAGATNTLPPEATATEPQADVPAPTETDV